MCDALYVIPLDSERICSYDFENAFYAHDHIQAPLVEQVSIDFLPSKMRADYMGYLHNQA